MKAYIAALLFGTLLLLPGTLRAQEGERSPSTPPEEEETEAPDTGEADEPEEAEPAGDAAEDDAAKEEAAEPEAPPASPKDAPAAPAEGDGLAPLDDLGEGDLGEELPAESFAGPELFRTNLYGYVDVQWRELAFTDGLPPPKEKKFPKEFRKNRGGTWLNMNVMLQGDVYERYHWFINLGVIKAADIKDGDASLDVRNGWVELPLWQERLLFRAGKTYRRFGLYNEILDAAPTFPGIEQPAYLVEGQTFMTRTTNLMLHGSWLLGSARLQYTLQTGTDERKGGGLPVSGDLRYHLGDSLVLGTSGYWSNTAAPTRAVGEGQPIGGVKNWMSKDEFYVVGGFAEVTQGPWLLQGEYWRAKHEADRNPAAVLQFVMAGAELNGRRRQRFFNGAEMPTASDVNVVADYVAETAYARLGYEFNVGDTGTFMPYVHLDWYKDPEAIAGPPLGGNEAGLSDDGVFYRSVIGAVYRPVPSVALKAELNPHYQEVAGETAIFTPFQASISYFWNLDQL